MTALRFTGYTNLPCRRQPTWARPRIEQRDRWRVRIGIDVGGTNTDAVLMEGNEVLAAVKTATTSDVTLACSRRSASSISEGDSRPSGSRS